MKVQLSKLLALGGLCAAFIGAGSVVMAQGYDNHRLDRGYRTQDARHELQVLHRVYDHEIRSGHPAAAMRAHMRAQAIRRQLREHGGWHTSYRDRDNW